MWLWCVTSNSWTCVLHRIFRLQTRAEFTRQDSCARREKETKAATARERDGKETEKEMTYVRYWTRQYTFTCQWLFFVQGSHAGLEFWAGLEFQNSQKVLELFMKMRRRPQKVWNLSTAKLNFRWNWIKTWRQLLECSLLAEELTSFCSSIFWYIVDQWLWIGLSLWNKRPWIVLENRCRKPVYICVSYGMLVILSGMLTSLLYVFYVFCCIVPGANGFLQPFHYVSSRKLTNEDWRTHVIWMICSQYKLN